MKTSSRSPRAIVAMPPLLQGQIQDAGLRRWLSRGTLRAATAAGAAFDQVLAELGQEAADLPAAALCFWGHTGERSGSWMAAIDLVHLEARLDRLSLHRLGPDTVEGGEFRQLFDFLQAEFGTGSLAFAIVGGRAFLRCDDGMATAALPAQEIDGQAPDEFMPAGPAAAMHDRLLGEIQMALHEHPLNLSRAERGLPVINSLWFWGGGIAPQEKAKPLPVLFSDDPLFRGYWLSRSAVVGSAPIDAEGKFDFEAMAQQAADALVVVMPAAGEDVDATLHRLRSLLHAGDLRQLTVLSSDGLRIDLLAGHRFRFWRPSSRALAPV